MATPSELSNRYWEMSEYLIRKAQEELDVSEDLMQASEKAWGSVAHAIKSICAKRGWNHHYHLLLRDAIGILQLEYDNGRLSSLFSSAEAMHSNFYEHRLEREDLQFHINDCKGLLSELDHIRNVPPPKVVSDVTSDVQGLARRMRRLATRDPDIAAREQALDITTLPPVEVLHSHNPGKTLSGRPGVTPVYPCR